MARGAPTRAPLPNGPGEGAFRQIVENGLDLVVVLDADGLIRFASPSHETVVGHLPGELVGQDPVRFMHPDDAPRVLELLHAASERTVEAAMVEFRFRHRDGSWRVLEAAGRSLLDDTGVHGVVVSSRDVTARHRAVAETALLLEVAHEAAGAVDHSAWMQRVLGSVLRGLPCSRAALWLLDPDRDVWRVAAHAGVPETVAPALEALEFPRGKPFDFRVERGGTVVVADAARQDWLSPALCQAFEIGAYLAVPVRAGDEHLGLALFARPPGGEAFDAGQLRVAEGVARQVGTALAAGDVYRKQREEAQVSGALALLGRELMTALDRPELLEVLCRVTAGIFGCEESYTILWHRETDEWVPLAGCGLPEAIENLPFIRVPGSMMAPVVEVLGADGPGASNEPGRPDDVAVSVFDVAAATTRPVPVGSAGDVLMALRRRDELIGVQLVRLPPGRPAFERWMIRVAPGLARMASLALEHGRVVAELEQALRLRTDFLATMSHELRTPLNVILGYSEMLQDDLASRGPLAAAATAGGGPAVEASADLGLLVGGIDRSARGLLELIENTLDLGRLETRRLELEPENLSATAFLEEVAREVRASWVKADVRFELRLGGELPVLRTDPRSLRIVVKNLISNAIKFTEHGRVRLSARARRGRLEIDVTDTGIGIPEEDQARIFEAYFQSARDRGHSGGGVGLGLYIVRQLAERLGGDVAVESRPGEGTRFRVRLPLAPPDDNR